MKHYLFYIAHNYAFEILRPLQQEIRSRGDSIAWFVEGNEINPDYFHQDEKVLDTVKQAATLTIILLVENLGVIALVNAVSTGVESTTC